MTCQRDMYVAICHPTRTIQLLNALLMPRQRRPCTLQRLLQATPRQAQLHARPCNVTGNVSKGASHSRRPSLQGLHPGPERSHAAQRAQAAASGVALTTVAGPRGGDATQKHAGHDCAQQGPRQQRRRRGVTQRLPGRRQHIAPGGDGRDLPPRRRSRVLSACSGPGGAAAPRSDDVQARLCGL